MSKTMQSVICAVAVAVPALVVAATQPVKPLIDTPLRDASICRGPDGIYYLTGTLANSANPADFNNNAGVRLWKSTDMVRWEDIGLVWDLAKDPNRWDYWMTLHRNVRDMPDSPLVRGITAPEIHYLKDTFWICYSINSQATGLLRSTTGKAEGPYADLGAITTRGGDPSLFADDDGKVYWLFDGGWIARMNDDMKSLAERPRLLMPEAASKNPGHAPLHVGSRGAFMFKEGGRYNLVCADFTDRLGGSACHDTFIASAEKIDGPYSPRRMMIPHGGTTTVFRDGEGKLYATFNGNDRFAMFRDRPGIVPIYYDGFLKHVRKSKDVLTERGAVAVAQPIELPNEKGIRDPQILLAPDGKYYLTATSSKATLRVPGCRVWRSDDLKTWEALGDDKGVVWYVDQDPWCAKPFKVAVVPQPVHDFWAPEIQHIKGTYYITFCMFGGGMGLLRSTSGKAEGPYESLGRLTPDGGDPTFLVDDDGAVYLVWSFGPVRIARMKDDMSGFAEPATFLQPPGNTRLGHEGASIVKINGKYILFHTSLRGEPEQERKGGEPSYHRIATYDLMYAWADKPKGPYSEPRLAVPHGGHGGIFKDKAGRWMWTFFGTDTTAPFHGKLAIVPLDISVTDQSVIIDVAEPKP